jgi:predicted porin
MKKSLLALAVLGAFAGVAQAQTSVTVYGSFDGGVRYVNNVNAAGDSRFSVSSNGTYNSNRLGFKGVEDLGGGLNARFNLETGFNTGTGAVESTTGSFGSTTPSATTGTGSFWNRTATVGLGGTWGGIDIGHQYSVSFKTIGLYDPFNYKYTGIIPLAGIAAGSGPTSVLGGTRFNNDLQYTGTFGPITARAEYALGEVAGANSSNRAYGLGASYANGPLTFGAAYTNKKVASTAGSFALGTAGGVATATTPGSAAAVAATPTHDDKAWTVGGAYTFGPARVALGYNDERLSGAVPTTALAGQVLTASAFGATARQRVGWAGVGFDISPAINVTGAWYNTRVDTPTAAALADGRRNLFILGATYAFSKRTNAYAEVDYTKLKGNQVLTSATASQDKVSGVSVGINHLF